MTPAQLLAGLLRSGDARTLRRVLRELGKNNGNVTHTARALGVAANTFRAWRNPASPHCIPALVPDRGQK